VSRTKSYHSEKRLDQATTQITQVILKVASRCNLDCSYCYVYNMADSTWENRPPVMSDETFQAALERIRRHCSIFGRQEHLRIAFHGGEPCLIGVKRFDRWCTSARKLLQDTVTLHLVIQTNGTLLDAAWAEAFLKHEVSVGISMDGPQELHDVFRIDHRGRGSYDRVERGIKILQENHIPFGVLCVIPLGSDPLVVHHHFVKLGCNSITYLMPHFTHDTIAPIRQLYGATPCADFLIPIFDDWWFNSTMSVRIGDLWNIARIIMGGNSQIETLGNEPPLYVFIEADGEIEGLDTLRACGEGIAKINLNVRDSDFHEILQTNTLHRRAIFQGMPLPNGCRACPERDSCGGGHLPHRYSRARGFDNPSVWCADLLKLFSHLRLRLGVQIEETYMRRQALRRDAVAASAPKVEMAS
jgi:uncharacterized protein